MKHIIKPAFSLFLIAALTTTTLGLIYRLTLEPIQNQHRRARERTMREVLAQADEFRELPMSALASAGAQGSIVGIFEGLRAGSRVGYVLELAPDGYSGPINMMVGISSAENNITGMRILRHSETPGLGSLAARESFFRRFDRRELSPLRVVVRTSPGAGEIEALTSATITTRAITDAVNEAIEWYNRGGSR